MSATRRRWPRRLLAALIVAGVAVVGLRWYAVGRLARVARAYRAAPALRLTGVYRLEYQIAGARSKLESPFTLAYRRPNIGRLSVGREPAATRFDTDGQTLSVELPFFRAVGQAPAPPRLADLDAENTLQDPARAAVHRLPTPDALWTGRFALSSVRRVRPGLPRGSWLAALPAPPASSACTVWLRDGTVVGVWLAVREPAVRAVAAELRGEQIGGATPGGLLGDLLRKVSLRAVASFEPVLQSTADLPYEPPADYRRVRAESWRDLPNALASSVPKPSPRATPRPAKGRG